MQSEVSYYGIHWADGNIAYLEQQSGGHNMAGLNQRSPFRVAPRSGLTCNHKIPLAIPKPEEDQQAQFLELCKDPLVQAMLPIPHKEPKAFYVWDQSDDLRIYLMLLAKMSSPLKSIVNPFWSMTTPAILAELSPSNVQPLALTMVKSTDTKRLNQIAEAIPNYPRTVIFTGDDDVVLPPNITLIDTNLDDHDLGALVALHWESLGAFAIKEWMKTHTTKPTY
jgi:hypothetical protein